MKTILQKAVLTAILAMFTVISTAHDFKVDGYYYTITSSSTLEVTYRGSKYDSYEEYGYYAHIPGKVTYNGSTYTVTGIGKEAFRGCTSLTIVTIPKSVTYIDDSAFRGCKSLESVTFFGNVTSIGASAFYDCSGLTTIDIPDSLMSIGSYAFYHCTGLTSADIPEGVTSIPDNAFRSCSSLTSVTIPNSVTSIGASAFEDCSGLLSVTIPSSVETIYSEAFYGCTDLASVTIEDGTNDLQFGSDVFDNASLDTLYVGRNFICINSSSSYSSSAPFYNQTTLKALTIGDNVTSIGDYAFRMCTQLRTVTIGSGVTCIGNYAFDGCTLLTSVTIGSGVTSIGKYAFCDCTHVTSMTSQAATPPTCNTSTFENFKRAECTLHVPKGTKSLYQAAGQWKAFYIVDDASIGVFCVDGIYYKVTSSKNLTVNVTYRGSSYDSYDEYTGDVSIPESVSYGGSTYAVTSIGASAFSDCTALTSVKIPESVTSIEASAFSGCVTMTSLTCEATTPPTCGTNAFNGIDKELCTLYVPEGTTALYQEADQWNDFYNIIEDVTTGDFCVDGIYYDITSSTDLTVEVTYKGDYYYSYSDEYTGDVSIPESVSYNGNTYTVTSIGASAFSDCTVLTSVVIPESVTSIGASAFSGCVTMTSLTCEATTPPTCGTDAFNGIDKELCTLHVPEGTTPLFQEADQWKDFLNVSEGTETDISIYTFNVNGIYYDITSFNDMTVKVTYKGSSYDSYNEYAGDITISEAVTYNGNTYSVTSIGNSAFCYCTGLTSVVIPSSVTSIGSDVFCGCSGLTSVTIGGGVTSIGTSAFEGCTGLKSITIPDNVTSIGRDVFFGCTELESVIIGSGVETVSDNAFWNCTGLTSVTIGCGVTSIGGYAFYNCTSMISLTSLATTPPTCGTNALTDIDKELCALYVPEESTALYQVADQWKDFYNIVDDASTGISALTSDTEGVKEVGRYKTNGQRVDGAQRGVNIVRYSDGSIKKVYVK